MSQMRQGWAAFDKKQRQKQVNGTEFDNDPYPSLSSTASFMRNCDNVTRNNGLSTRPFSSVLLPSVDFPTLTENKDVCGDSDSRGKHGNKIIEENNHDLALKKLKGLYSWADNSLIEDIMATVDDNIEMASTRLKEKVSSCSSEENKEAKTAELSSNIDDFLPDKRTEENLLLEMTVAFSDLSSTSEDNVKDNCRKLTDVYASDNAANLKHLPSIPVEPEWWEEDDVYLSHRKDAIKAMRSASQHSKAAQNAFFRGDQYSSQQHSLMAREERLIAERLNSKAAKEILSIRNSENDMWKLDLHGLHAAEAVQALQERLQRIEMQVPMNRSVSPNRLEAKNGMVRTPSLDLLSCMDMENVDKQQAPFRQRQTSLQVITGIGIHSRGQAALSAAIRSLPVRLEGCQHSVACDDGFQPLLGDLRSVAGAINHSLPWAWFVAWASSDFAGMGTTNCENMSGASRFDITWLQAHVAKLGDVSCKVAVLHVLSRCGTYCSCLLTEAKEALLPHFGVTTHKGKTQIQFLNHRNRASN